MPPGCHYEFGQYRLEMDGRLLSHSGQRIVITPKAVDLLVALLEAEGKPVGKEELLQRVWPDAVVEEGSLTSHISLLRRALGDGADGRRFIETIPKRGYRFIGSFRQVSTQTPITPGRPLLVVLPFENLNAGEKHDYFSEGLTEEMISQLARLSPEKLGVIARTSAMQYKSTSKTVQQIARELGVSYVLEGSLRRASGRVRITAQLIRVSDSSHLWAQSYERDSHDILALQGEVARAIAHEIQIKLTPREQSRLDRARSLDPLAYELYLQGRYFWSKRTEQGMRKSIECFEKALARDPRYPAALDGISDAYTMLACRGVISAAEAFHKAKTAARLAVQIDPELGEGHASLAHVRLHDWDWVGLEEDFTQALELNPGYTIAHYWYAEYLMAMGRSAEAIARVRLAQRMDPVNSLLNASVGMILYLAREYDQALAELLKSSEFDPTHFLLHFRLGLVYAKKGFVNEAIAEMQKAVILSGRSTEALTGLAHAYASGGNEPAVRDTLRELIQPGGRYASPYDIARVYSVAGDQQQAFDWLERAYQEHNPDLIELKMEPSFDQLRADPRFQDLVLRIGW